MNNKRKKKFLGRTTSGDGYMDPKAAALLKHSEPEWLIASKKIPDEPIPRAPVRSSKLEHGTGARMHLPGRLRCRFGLGHEECWFIKSL